MIHQQRGGICRPFALLETENNCKCVPEPEEVQT